MIVLDANILIRAILGRRVRFLLEKYSRQGVRFAAPREAFSDAERHLPTLLKKFGITQHGSTSTQYLYQLVEELDKELYANFEPTARKRLKARDEEDWPVLACALALGCAVWTEDADFFGTGVAVWNTKNIETFLKSQVDMERGESE